MSGWYPHFMDAAFFMRGEKILPAQNSFLMPGQGLREVCSVQKLRIVQNSKNEHFVLASAPFPGDNMADQWSLLGRGNDDHFERVRFTQEHS
ncbi:MAG TPA: hypothetical protein ENN87_08795 [Phycisphaerales bacterium]|nr:hypothetical protein [Phycisphaerales bacterium]